MPGLPSHALYGAGFSDIQIAPNGTDARATQRKRPRNEQAVAWMHAAFCHRKQKLRKEWCE